MISDIISPNNDIIKHIKHLAAQKSYRQKTNSFIIEGQRLVFDAIAAKAQAQLLLISSSFDTTQLQEVLDNLKIIRVPDKLFNTVSDTQTPQGILAVVMAKAYSLSDILTVQNPLILFCDNVTDPGNLGTIIRTADAAGANGVILSKGCVELYNPKTIRSTMASVFNIPVIYAEDSVVMLRRLKEIGISIAVGELTAELSYNKVNMKKGLAITVGNEANGVSSSVIAEADIRLKIPMPGRAESLNVAAAASIMMYEAVRQRYLED